MTSVAAPVSTKHIFIVDDDELVRILLRETFWIYSHGPVEVTTARSIAEAREKMPEVPPSSVFFVGLSLITPGGGGSTREIEPSLRFIEDIKHEHPETKVVIYSKHTEPELKEQALAAGADHYMVKGEYTPSEIVDFVEGL